MAGRDSDRDDVDPKTVEVGLVSTARRHDGRWLYRVPARRPSAFARRDDHGADAVYDGLL